MVLLSGALFVISAQNSEGTDLRPGRYTDLASLVRDESARYDDLKQQVLDLNAEVETLTEALNDRDVDRLQREIGTLRDPAGLVPRTGPGITVTLADAPEDVIKDVEESGVHDLNLLVVHQQDIQAVVNAMWKGGATAVTIAGQRVISTTGIKCEGNAVTLQGQPYPQPFVISAVGDPAALAAAIDADDYLTIYREQSEVPDIAVGWDLATQTDLTAPAYDGLLDLTYATPLS